MHGHFKVACKTIIHRLNPMCRSVCCCVNNIGSHTTNLSRKDNPILRTYTACGHKPNSSSVLLIHVDVSQLRTIVKSFNHCLHELIVTKIRTWIVFQPNILLPQGKILRGRQIFYLKTLFSFSHLSQLKNKFNFSDKIAITNSKTSTHID